MRLFFVLFLLAWLLPACATPTPAVTPQVANFYATSAASPWLSAVYDCAPASVAVNLSDAESAQVTLRLGEPDHLATPAYQIASEDIVVVVHPQTGVGALTLEQVRQLFLGQVMNWQELGGNDLPVQVWTFSPDEDIQAIFDRTVMHGQPVTSLARLAVSAQSMSEAVGTQPGSVGVLTRRWQSGDTSEAFVAASAPVLAVVKSEPQGDLRELLGCLQSGK